MAEQEHEQETRAEQAQSHTVELSDREAARLGRMNRHWDVITGSPAMKRLAPEGREIAGAIIVGMAEVARAIEEGAAGDD